MIKSLKEEILKKRMNMYSAVTAFYLFLSLIPIFLLVVKLIPYTPLKLETLLERSFVHVPGPLKVLLVNLVVEAYKQPQSRLSLSVLLALWSAGRGMYFIGKGLNEIDESKEERGFIASRILASFYTLILLLVLLFSFSAPIIHFPAFFSFLFQTAVIAAVYSLVPDQKRSCLTCLPGALLTSFAWICYSNGFAWYVNYKNGISAFDGISMIVLFLVWLYFDLYIFFLGAFFNIFMENRRNEQGKT